MCGIFGIVSTQPRGSERLLRSLFQLSESRGKEASGLAGIADDTIHVLKSPIPASRLLRTPTYSSYAADVIHRSDRVAVIGHSRLVTNGDQTEAANNQPVFVDDIAGVHNGIIVNEAKLWSAHPELTRAFEVDTEILLRLVRHFARAMSSFVAGVRQAMTQIAGVANVAMFASELDQLTLATNNGSIYYSADPQAGLFAFASERYILETALRRAGLSGLAIEQLAAGSGLLVDLSTARGAAFSLSPSAPAVTERNGVQRRVTVREVDADQRASSLPRQTDSDTPPQWFVEEEQRNREAIAKLRRCVRCVQPETVPFVGLDRDGLCVDCRHSQPLMVRGREALEALLAPHRSTTGRAEVLVPLSGGRDSSYTLHYLKRVLGLHPIAYTYDWGLVTDLARRNCSRLCSRLGVEHIVVSADIHRKRSYVRKNVEAWLKQPDLGIVPLFMAGDKHFSYYAEQIQRRTGVAFQIVGHNALERSDFKTGFCGFDRGGYKDNSLIHMGLQHSLKYIGYFLSSYVRNPAYLNSSIPDTVSAYYHYFKTPNYLSLYDFIRWDEQTIVRTLIDEYDWELSPDTPTTWRIGDGTAAFYNYIYWTAAGFTESDTFRSNQIRQDMMTRDGAMEIVNEENRPRYPSLNWYCRTIGLDLERTLRTINAIPKHYPV